MKKRISMFTFALIISFCLVSCGSGRKEETNYNISYNSKNEYFTTIVTFDDKNNTYKIVYANDTKVKYFITTSYYRYGITPLYNADGTLQIYEESEE